MASQEASKILASYLENVVSQGSGKNAYIEGYKVGGKTGTAQKYENGIIAQGKYVMSFIGFFPSSIIQVLNKSYSKKTLLVQVLDSCFTLKNDIARFIEVGYV